MNDYPKWPRTFVITTPADATAATEMLATFEKVALLPGITPALRAHFRRQAVVVRTQLAEYDPGDDA